MLNLFYSTLQRSQCTRSWFKLSALLSRTAPTRLGEVLIYVGTRGIRRLHTATKRLYLRWCRETSKMGSSVDSDTRKKNKKQRAKDLGGMYQDPMRKLPNHPANRGTVAIRKVSITENRRWGTAQSSNKVYCSKSVQTLLLLLLLSRRCKGRPTDWLAALRRNHSPHTALAQKAMKMGVTSQAAS